MQDWEFAVVGTKTAGVTARFDLTDPHHRRKYFAAKAGPEIAKVRQFLHHNTFVAFLLGKKNSGKGTYWSMLREIFGTERLAMISVGDLVREIHRDWDRYSAGPQYQLLCRYYRGYISLAEAEQRLKSRSTTTLLPSEFILAALKARLSQMEKKAVFIDGLPRDTDQVSYSLFFRDLANYRDDPDLFIMIDIPISVIDERIKYRVVCPRCNNSRNTKLLVTRDIGYDSARAEFYLRCDNPDCLGQRMVPKEGDNLGIGPLRPRLEKDEEILEKVARLHGVPQIRLRNHVPVSEVAKFDDYELTPEYVLRWDAKRKRVEVHTRPWIVTDDNGVPSYSLLAPPVTLSLLKQLPAALGID